MNRDTGGIFGISVLFVVVVGIIWAFNSFIGWVAVEAHLAGWGTWQIGAALLALNIIWILVQNGVANLAK